MTGSEPLVDAVRDFFVRAHRTLDRLMTQQGASFARTKLLLYLDREKCARSADIAATFGHAPRTVTEAIDGLERDGLVRREPDPSDGRAKRIVVTEAGKRAIEKVEPIRQQFSEHVYGALNAEEQATLLAIMRKLNERLDI